jgi:hypothetical protein
MSMSAEPAPPEVPLPRIRRAIEPLSAAGATEVNLRLTLAETANRGYEYGINGLPFPKAAPIAAKPGETQLWTVFNDTKWAHPLHLHGFFFQVVDAARTPLRPLAWKDTVNVPANGTVRLLVRFDEREGEWMYHCHILDHAEGGLMSVVRLSRPGEAPPPLPSEHTPHGHSTSGR